MKKLDYDFFMPKYRFHSIKRIGRLFSFWTFGLGAHSRWALIKSFRHFQTQGNQGNRGGRLFE